MPQNNKQIELCYRTQIPCHCYLTNQENNEPFQSEKHKQPPFSSDLPRFMLVRRRIRRRNKAKFGGANCWTQWRQTNLNLHVTDKKNPGHTFHSRILFKARNTFKRKIVEGLLIQRSNPSLNKQLKCFVAQLFPRRITWTFIFMPAPPVCFYLKMTSVSKMFIILKHF